LHRCTTIHKSKRYQTTLSSVDFDDESNIKKHERLSTDKKDLILTILNSTATKREARSYLSKYRLLEENDIYKNKQKIVDQDDDNINSEPSSFVHNKRYSNYIKNFLDSETVNVIYANSKVSANDASNEIKLTQKIRACVLRIRRLDKWDDEKIRNLGIVLRKAMCLGASPVVIIDGDIANGCESTLEKDIEAFIESKLENFIVNLGDQIPSRIVQGCFDLMENGKLNTVIPEMIGVPIFSGLVPVISPFVVTARTLEKRCIKGFELTKETVNCLQSPDIKDILSVEKIVFVDEIGGFPSVERSDGSHVLINLLQEYDDIRDEIENKLNLSDDARLLHLSNLLEMKEILDKSPYITGILTTPHMATKEEEKQVDRETNPIIYNILTDRPTISSSLPVSLRRTPQLNTTVIKHGMPISLFLCKNSNSGLDLKEMNEKGQIDLAKLKFLIDDSFGRDLNINHYLNRVNGKIAGLIIAGDYEGGAIITWEDTGDRLVAYLDKFAVIKKLQGIPGIADIVFKVMLNNFKDELLWRSRKNNPVNKWYFERSKANYSIPDTQWRLFFTGEKELTLHNLEEYQKICGSIKPSFDIPN
jgi:amino-acid N-acetyltransferase